MCGTLSCTKNLESISSHFSKLRAGQTEDLQYFSVLLISNILTVHFRAFSKGKNTYYSPLTRA